MQSARLYIRKLGLVLLAAYFLLAAALQYNDRDPLHWILLYASSSLLCAAALMRRRINTLAWIITGMALTEMSITADGLMQWLRSGGENILTTQMSAAKPYIELTREFLGALISFAVALVLLRSQRGQSTSP